MMYFSIPIFPSTECVSLSEFLLTGLGKGCTDDLGSGSCENIITASLIKTPSRENHIGNYDNFGFHFDDFCF